MNAAEAIVRVRGVHKYFTRGSERVDVLQDLSLDVPTGEFLALMGPSGSGKTTTLRMVAGFIEPTAGHVKLGGTDVTLKKFYRENGNVRLQPANPAVQPLIVAADTGGTFTDLAAYDQETGRLTYTKSLTTYGNLVDGVMDCIRKAEVDLARADAALRNAANLWLADNIDIYENGRLR